MAHPRLTQTRCNCLAAFCLLVSTAPAWAQPETQIPPDEALFLGEVPVILSATRLAQPPSESPASVTVIDRKMIDASGAIDIPDLFRLVPGFQVGHVSGYWSVVTSHGLSDAFARRLQVLVDGRSVYTPAFGGVLWADLALAIEDIDRIEIIRGPNAATHGANSVSATINIITRHPSQDQGSYLKMTRGGLDTDRVVARYGATDGPFTYRLTAGYRDDIGFPDMRDNQRVSLLTYRGEYQASARDTVDIQAGINRNRREEGKDGSLTDISRDEDTTNSYQYLRWRRVLGTHSEWSLLYTHDYYKNPDSFQSALLSQILGIPFPNVFFPTTPDQPLAVNEDLITERHNIEFQHIHSFGDGLRLVWGAEARSDRARGQGWFGKPSPVTEYLNRLFANTEWRFAPDWLLNAGLMYEHTEYSEGDWSPRLAVNHHLSPEHTLRASAARALRTPSLFEQRADAYFMALDGTLIDRLYLATRPLKPEQMTSYELGYLGEFPGAALTTDFKFFREELRQIISAVRDNSIADPIASTTPYTFYNDGEADINGAEAQFKWRPLARTQFVYAHAYAHQRGFLLDKVTGGVPTYQNTDNSTPVSTRSLLAIHEFAPRVEGSLAYYRVGNMKFFGGDQTGGFRTLDARLSVKLRNESWYGELSLVGQNLLGDYFDFDKSDSAHAFFGRRYLLTLGLHFH